MRVRGRGVEVLSGLVMVEVGAPGAGDSEAVEVGKIPPAAVGDGICVAGGMGVEVETVVGEAAAAVVGVEV